MISPVGIFSACSMINVTVCIRRISTNVPKKTDIRRVNSRRNSNTHSRRCSCRCSHRRSHRTHGCRRRTSESDFYFSWSEIHSAGNITHLAIVNDTIIDYSVCIVVIIIHNVRRDYKNPISSLISNCYRNIITNYRRTLNTLF